MYMLTCEGIAKIKADIEKFAPFAPIDFELLIDLVLDLEARAEAGLELASEISEFLTESGRVEYVRLDASHFEEIENVTV